MRLWRLQLVWAGPKGMGWRGAEGGWGLGFILLAYFCEPYFNKVHIKIMTKVRCVG